MVVLFETLHTAGLALLVFFVLPDLDAVKGVMLTNCVCIVPGVLGGWAGSCLSLMQGEKKPPYPQSRSG